MSPNLSHLFDRRRFLNRFGMGLGGIALADLMGASGASAAPSSASGPTPLEGGVLPVSHLAPKAKRVIYLFQSGGPSQIDLLDHKPLLNEKHGEELPDELAENADDGRGDRHVLGEKCDRENLKCSTYTHPIGYFGHAPGPTIGMWDNQGLTPERGDWEVYANTAYSIEGNARRKLDMWDGQYVVIKLEQDAVFDGQRVWYLAGRQTEWLLVR